MPIISFAHKICIFGVPAKSSAVDRLALEANKKAQRATWCALFVGARDIVRDLGMSLATQECHEMYDTLVDLAPAWISEDLEMISRDSPVALTA